MIDKDSLPATLPLSDGAKLIHLRHICEQAGLMLDDPDKRLAAQRLLAKAMAETATHSDLTQIWPLGGDSQFTRIFLKTQAD